MLLNSQRTLYQSNLFRRASIDVSETDDSLKHVLVAVQEAPPHDALYSAGFTTMDFVQVQGQYSDFNWLGGAKRLDSRRDRREPVRATSSTATGSSTTSARIPSAARNPSISHPTYTASADMRYPWFGSPNNEIGVGAFVHRRSSPGIYVDRGFGFTGTFTRRLTPRAPASLNYRYEVTKHRRR